jgi:hypothetical protein
MPSRLPISVRSLAPIAVLALALFAFPQTGRAGESARSNTQIGEAVRVERRVAAAADAPAWTLARRPASAPERKLLVRASLAAGFLVLNVLLLRRRRAIHNWDSC